MIEAIFSWTTLWWIMLVVQAICCICLIGIILLQKGKGGGLSGAFGMGAGAETVFGPRASRSLPARLTQVLAGIFMVLALAMSMVAPKVGKGVAPELVTVEQAAPALQELEGMGIEVLPDTEGAAPAGGAAAPDAAAPAEAVEAVEATPEAPAEEPAAPVETPAEEAAPAETTPPASGAN